MLHVQQWVKDLWLLTPRTSTPVKQALRTRHLLPLHLRIISAAEPIEPPETSVSPFLWQIITVVPIRISTVFITEISAVELLRASIIHPHSAAGHGDIKMVLSKVRASVNGLNDHFFAGYRASSEYQPDQTILSAC
jgi:hypothetical protein